MRLSLLFLLCSVVVGMPLRLDRTPMPTNLQVVQNFKLQQLEAGDKLAQQPFHNQVKVSFSLFDKDFEHDLFVNTELHHKDAVVNVYNGDIIVESYTPQLLAYRTAPGDYPIVSAYIYNDKQVHAMVVTEDEIYTIDPTSEHLSNPHLPTTLAAESPSGMVGYKLSEVQNLPFGMPELPKQDSASSRKLLQYEAWTQCWPGQNAAGKSVVVSFAADASYYNLHKANAQAKIYQIVSDSNALYGGQLNMYWKVKQVDIRQTTSGIDAWNQVRPASGNCVRSTSQTLDSFRAWKASQHPDDAGVWHLMTDCYRPPGVVGVAYVGVLCSKAYGAGLSSDHGSTTWKTVAHEIGHNFNAGHTFHNGQGRTGGLMDYADGTYPQGKGPVQFHPANKQDVCAHLTETMNRPAHQNCYVNGGGGAPAPTPTTPNPTPKGSSPSPATLKPTPQPQPDPYTWQMGPEKSQCSKACGGGTMVAVVTCRNASNKVVSESLCPGIKKPIPPREPCNPQTCAPVCGNKVVEQGEECDGGDCCTAQCKRDTTSNQCRKDNAVRDACFASLNTGKLYVFQGPNYVRYSDLEGKNKDAGYPKRIVDGWTKLDPHFHNGIDAAVPTADDSVYLIKGDKVSKYHFGSGQVSGYPRSLGDVFKGMQFSKGVDDAVNIPGGAYFFKNDEYDLFLWHAPVTGASIYPRPIGDWNMAFTSIDASVNIDSANAVDFYKGNQKLRYVWGIGQQDAPALTAGLQIGDDTLVTTKCPANCVNCNDAGTCLECDEGFIVQSDSSCSPQLYLTELKFEDRAAESKLIKSTNVLDAQWVAGGGATGGGLVLTQANRVELELMPNPKLPDFQLHLWVNLAKATVEQQKICTVELKDGRTVTWALEPNTLDTDLEDNSMLLVLRVGDIFVRHPAPVVVGDWHHLMGILYNGFATAMVDANSMVFPYNDKSVGSVLSDEDADQAEVFELTRWYLGADEGQSNGLIATIDTFHIASKGMPKEVSSATSVSASLVMIVPLVLSLVGRALF